MNINKYLLNFKKKFDIKLNIFLEQKLLEAKQISPKVSQSISEIKSLNQAGGKRLRPFLIYNSFKGYGGKGEIVWQSCLAIELIHTFALIHDDIMDKSSLRRGEISCFKKIGLNKAILVGDLALSFAYELICDKAKKYFDFLLQEVIYGQYLDIDKTNNLKLKTKKNKDEEDIFKIMEYKTARYSFARPLQIGAILAGAEENEVNKLFKLGINLGLAFQIQDDLTGIFGDKKAGKPIGLDISEGKKTLLTIRSLKNKSFTKVFGKGKPLNQKQLQDIQKLMVKLGGLDYCQQQVVRYIARTKKELKCLKINHQEKETLLRLSDYIKKRTY